MHVDGKASRIGMRYPKEDVDYIFASKDAGYLDNSVGIITKEGPMVSHHITRCEGG